MNLGKVIGTVVSTHIAESMQGVRLLVVQYVDQEGKPTGSQVVAADAMGAGPGEMVLVATGSSARQTTATQNRPCDAVVMAIVDQWDIENRTVYKKSAEG